MEICHIRLIEPTPQNSPVKNTFNQYLELV